MESLSPSSIYTLTEDLVYALPVKLMRIAVYTASGIVQISEDNDTWTNLTLNVNNEANVGSKYIQCIDDDAIVILKPIRTPAS